MIYGVYKSLDEAREPLSDIARKLREKEPLQITGGGKHETRFFLSPAYRVHYVVCEAVERPMDRRS